MNLTGFAIVPLIVGLVQTMKVAGVSPRYLPLIAVVLGILIVASLAGITSIAILTGAVAGLGAVGLYETGKTTVLGK